MGAGQKLGKSWAKAWNLPIRAEQEAAAFLFSLAQDGAGAAHTGKPLASTLSESATKVTSSIDNFMLNGVIREWYTECNERL